MPKLKPENLQKAYEKVFDKTAAKVGWLVIIKWVLAHYGDVQPREEAERLVESLGTVFSYELKLNYERELQRRATVREAQEVEVERRIEFYDKVRALEEEYGLRAGRMRQPRTAGDDSESAEA